MNSIIEILTEYQVDFRHAGESSHVTSGWIGVICPYCGEGTGKYGLGIHLERLTCSCWKCGSHYLPEVIQLLTRLPWSTVREILRGLPKHTTVPGERIVGTLRFPPGIEPMALPHRNYLKGRNIDPDYAAQVWGVRGIGLTGSLAWRLFIPVSLRGEIVTWTTRALSDEGIRYLSAAKSMEKYSIKSLLLGEDLTRNAIVVCEGPLDAIRIGPGAVATCGLGVSPEQRARIALYPTRVICFDNEPEAQRRAQKLCRDLEVYPGTTTNILLETGKDPGDCDRSEIEEIRRRFL